jgi:hypothetical protein
LKRKSPARYKALLRRDNLYKRSRTEKREEKREEKRIQAIKTEKMMELALKIKGR